VAGMWYRRAALEALGLGRPWFAWPGATLAALALGAWTTGLGEASGG
jgi:hypothetical protein